MPSESGYSGSLRAATRAPGRVTRRACARTRSASLRSSACCLRAVPAASSAERCGASGALATQTSTVDARAAVREILTEAGDIFARDAASASRIGGKKRARDSRTTRRFRRIAKRIDLLLAKSPFGLSKRCGSGFFRFEKNPRSQAGGKFLFFAICLVAEIDRSADRMSVLFRRDARLEEISSSSDARGRTKRERRRRERDAT